MNAPFAPLTHPMPGGSATLPRIVAVGYRRINKLLQDLAPAFAVQAHVEVLDVGFEQAVERVHAMHAQSGVDVLVAAGSNGAYLRQHLDRPVVLVKVGGFDVLRAMAHAHALLDAGAPARIGLVTYAGMAPDLSTYQALWRVEVVQHSYQSEEEAALCVEVLRQAGISVVVGPGAVVDQAELVGMKGVFLYSVDAVREALNDAIEVARAARIELSKRERLATILTQLSDGVIAVNQQEQIETLNPAMAQWLGIEPGQWQGQRLSDVCPALSLQATLRLGAPELDRIERVASKSLIVNRMPILEQGRLTGAVLTSQDPVRIQRVDRFIRSRIKAGGAGPQHELSAYLGEGPAATQLRSQAARCAQSQGTVLLVGESGTGKEIIAQGIHLASERRDMPFVVINCAAVAESLLESELFGYEEGAFTGARRGGKMGLFEAAHNGTLFLDEVGEMPLPLQAKLLRVLEAREVLRVGATEPTPVNVRVIAATHRDLQAHVAQGQFRLDLLYRLDILQLRVPPLRERMEDFAQLATTLHRRLCERLNQPAQATAPLLQTLIAQAGQSTWPGNVRQLENLIERTVVLGAACVQSGCAPEYPAAPTVRMPPPYPAASSMVRPSLARIQAVLSECDGDKAQAALRLGISRTTLWRKLKQQV